MSETALVGTIGVMIVAGAAVTFAGRLVRMPSIVCYILAGLGLAALTGLVAPDSLDRVHVVGELGIILLLFVVGLELNLERIRQVGKVAVLAGLGQVAFTAAGGVGLALLLGFDWMASVLIATALTFSSTVVVVKLLDQKGELSSLYGRIAVGIFLVQDLVVIVVLTFVAGLDPEAESGALPVLVGLGKAFGGMGLLLALSLASARWILPRPMAWAARSPQTLFLFALCLSLGFVLAAEHMGLSPEIGAFLAGLSVAQLDCAHELRRRVHPLMSFFIAVFFVSLGAGMRLADASAYWMEAVVLSLFVLIGNPFIFMWIIAKSGYSERTSFFTSVTVAQISEFSFILGATGVAAGLIGPPVLSLIMVVGLVTIGVSAYMILFNRELYAVVRRLGLLRMFGASQGEDEEPPAERMQGHVVVVGMNDLGRRLVRALAARGEPVLAIDTDPRKLADLPCRTLHGSVEHPETLEEAGVPHARLAISTLRIEATNRLFAYRAKGWGVPVAIHAFDRSVVDGLRALDVDLLIDSKGYAAASLREAVGAPGEGAT
ncbi:MAG: cation:proton antiporter [Sandaracinaceae bacterium]|nr:cation:proton antiporter [Sandaracinaceae bacterium]